MLRVKQFDFKNALKIMSAIGGTWPYDNVKLYSSNDCLKMIAVYVDTFLSVDLPCCGDDLKPACVNIRVLQDLVKLQTENSEEEEVGLFSLSWDV